MAHISLITLAVDDLAGAARFYETMGWRRSSASVDGTVAFLRGGAVLLTADRDLALRAVRRTRSGDSELAALWEEADGPSWSLEVDDLIARLETLAG